MFNTRSLLRLLRDTVAALKVEPFQALFILALVAFGVIAYALTKVPSGNG